jgi:hypothetical protein
MGAVQQAPGAAPRLGGERESEDGRREREAGER